MGDCCSAKYLLQDKKATAEAPIEMFVLANDSGKQADKQAAPGGFSEHFVGRCLKKIAQKMLAVPLMGSSDRPRWLLCRGWMVDSNPNAHQSYNPGLLTPTMIHPRSTPTTSNRQEHMTIQSLTHTKTADSGHKNDLAQITRPRQTTTQTDAKKQADLMTKRLTNNTQATQGSNTDLQLITPPRQEISILERNPKRKRGSDDEYEEPPGKETHNTPESSRPKSDLSPITPPPQTTYCVLMGNDRSPDGWDQIPYRPGGWVLHQTPWSFGFDSQTRGTRENRRTLC